MHGEDAERLGHAEDDTQPRGYRFEYLVTIEVDEYPAEATGQVAALIGATCDDLIAGQQRTRLPDDSGTHHRDEWQAR